MPLQLVGYKLTKYFLLATFGCLLVFSFAACEKLILGNDSNQNQAGTYTTRFTQVLDSLRLKSSLPALAGAVILTDTILYADAVGCREMNGPVNVTSNDQFHLGSCTKAITAALIGILVDEKKLDWNSTLIQLFPEYSEIMREEYKLVTVKQILSHTSGIERTPSVDPVGNSLTEQRLSALKTTLQRYPVTLPGHFSYSNLGYMVAASIAEKVTGQEYEKLLMDKLLTPLGITSAGFGPMGTSGAIDQPRQHTIYGTPIVADETSDLIPSMDPAGRLHLSISDWSRFIQFIMQARLGNSALLSKASANVITTGFVNSDVPGSTYAMGWYVSHQEMANGEALTHGGCNGLNYFAAWISPTRGLAVIAATNIATPSTFQSINDVLTRLIILKDKGN
ncbi:MAG: beta-lactamase family protein [Ignavibacteria bacterium]|nr:beta-lactamase family protein [Ignavibacteria bacterium]